MHIDFLKERFLKAGESDALVWQDQTFSYAYMLERLEEWQQILEKQGIIAGSIVSVEADFSPQAVALMLALVDRNCIIVPLSSSVDNKKQLRRSPHLRGYTKEC